MCLLPWNRASDAGEGLQRSIKGDRTKPICPLFSTLASKNEPNSARPGRNAEGSYMCLAARQHGRAAEPGKTPIEGSQRQTWGITPPVPAWSLCPGPGMGARHPGRESSNSKKLAVADGGVARGGRGGSASTRAPGLRRANCFRVAGRDLGFRGIVRGIAFGSKSCGFRKWVGMGHSALGLMDHPYPNWAYDPGSPGAETYI